MTEGISKPPIGIMPKRFHDGQRLQDLANAINRRLCEPYEIPLEWVTEYNQLVEILYPENARPLFTSNASSRTT